MVDFLSTLSAESLLRYKNICISTMEMEAKEKGARDSDLEISRKSGFHPLDVMGLCKFTEEFKLLLVFRCPKLDSRGFIGLLPPKWMTIKDKSNDIGILRKNERWHVSDYDLMCIYRINANGTIISPVFASGTDSKKERSSLSPEATSIIVGINKKLINKLQHGAQDDWNSKKNRGVKMNEDVHLAVMLGRAEVIGNGHHLLNFYEKNHMKWPYDRATGEYLSS